MTTVGSVVGLPGGLAIRTAAPQELALQAARQVLTSAGIPPATAMAATLGTSLSDFGSGSTPEILAALKSTTGIPLSESDAKGLRTVGDMVRLLASQ